MGLVGVVASNRWLAKTIVNYRGAVASILSNSNERHLRWQRQRVREIRRKTESTINTINFQLLFDFVRA